MNGKPSPEDFDEVFPCVGICLPDEDEAYCIGCGRPWGEPAATPTEPGNEDGPAQSLADAPAPRRTAPPGR